MNLSDCQTQDDVLAFAPDYEQFQVELQKVDQDSSLSSDDEDFGNRSVCLSAQE